VAGDADVIVICVPTPLSESDGPDLTAVRAATETAAALVRPGSVVVLESTTYPGTTEEIVRPLLEKASGLAAGIGSISRSRPSGSTRATPGPHRLRPRQHRRERAAAIRHPRQSHQRWRGLLVMRLRCVLVHHPSPSPAESFLAANC
jgi:hypothetical protein